MISAQPFTIGRHPDNELPLANATVSGHHAELVFVGNDLFVRDPGSTNGSFLNGRRVDGLQRLCEGDMLQLGTAMFTVRRQSDAISGATVAADVADHALAHLQFDKLIHEPAVVPFFQPIVRMADGCVDQREVQIDFEHERVRDIQARLRRTRLTQPPPA